MFDYIVHCTLVFLAESLSVDKQNVVFTHNKWNVFPPVKGGTHVTTWMNLEDIILRGRSQSQRNIWELGGLRGDS